MAPRWLIAQSWRDLLFAHWPVPRRALERLLPAGVELDLYEGEAWLGVVPFTMTGTRLARGPRVPSRLPELNVRTYVRAGGRRGVWFLSLDTPCALAVSFGRRVYGLAYRRSRLDVIGGVAWDGERLRARYAPAAPGSLEHFLAERYRLFAAGRRELVRAEVAHEPWPLQRARGEVELGELLPAGLAVSGDPLLHFARRVDVLISRPLPA